jgi:hypothetical protein
MGIDNKHTSLPWSNGYGEGVTGPTTPSPAGPTCGEACEIYDWDNSDKKGTYPQIKHTVIKKGMTTIAIVVGDNREADAALIHKACNSYYAREALIGELAASLEECLEYIEAKEAHAGKALNTEEYEREKRRVRETIAKIGTGRWVGDAIFVDLDKARAAVAKVKS